MERRVNAGRFEENEGRSLSQSPWPYTHGRFQNGMVGLANGGLTCCVNAVLQSFYLAPEFTSILQRWDQRREVVDWGNIPYGMCRLFDVMQASMSGVVSAEMFLQCLTLNHVKANKQHDAEELFLNIFNLLLDQLQNSDMAEEMKSLYEIKLEEFVNCQCGKVSVKDSSMWSLPLPLSGMGVHRSLKLEDSLKMFFRPQDLTMKNKCFCPDCGVKCPALQGVKLISVPKILNLQLNRFRAPSRRGDYVKKIYSSVTFSEMLNLNNLPISEKAQKCGIGQESWLYQLYAVLTHSGSSVFGHYTVYVKSFKDSQWYHLDDAQVQWEDVTETFGSCDYLWGKTAYMLLYKRVEREEPPPADGH
ncbi:ubl carboxyl-terminal hydrolase 18 isoform X2 [Heptranchias perlo]|uniref:ubl carboxyl-terminal hydrolase 18 isoform X2 n=1 Tax=Heptranchias perlo TaxID=212740 RepID=UPI003559584A